MRHYSKPIAVCVAALVLIAWHGTQANETTPAYDWMSID